MNDKVKIRLLRLYLKMDQYQVTEKLNMSVADYSKIETGLTALTPEVSGQLTEIFGLSINELDDIIDIKNLVFDL